MAELGIKVYRMGFAWSRIMPDASGDPNPEGLAFYDQLIDYLLERGIEPLVTLYHFECPSALVEAFGGLFTTSICSSNPGWEISTTCTSKSASRTSRGASSAGLP